MVRTLIVDDDPSALKLLRLRLLEIGCNIIGAAGSIHAAVNIFEAGELDLVTLDVHMPTFGGEDTFSLFRAIRSERPETAVVIVSGVGYHSFRDTFMREGAIGYFGKPIDFHALSSRLRLHFPELKRAALRSGT